MKAIRYVRRLLAQIVREVKAHRKSIFVFFKFLILCSSSSLFDLLRSAEYNI